MVAAGYPEATEGVWSDAMIDGAVIWGDEEKCAEGVQRLFEPGRNRGAGLAHLGRSGRRRVGGPHHAPAGTGGGRGELGGV